MLRRPGLREVYIALMAIFFINHLETSAFNLSPVPNLEIRIPKLPTGLPQIRSSYFGFSIVMREKSIIIGAPRAQSTLESQATINETGAIYRCPLSFRRSMESSPAVDCDPYIFEKSSNQYYNDRRYNEIRDFQWLGGAMDGGTADNEPLLVCAPRFDGSESFHEEDHDYLHGICYRSANTLYNAPVKTGVWKFKPLTLGPQHRQGFYYFQLGQLGFSAHITPDNEEYIMGAPGIDNWGGSVVRFSTWTQQFEVPEQLFSNQQLTYTGYAVASGYLNSNERRELYYVTTAPHENMELGQAYIFRYSASHRGDSDLDVYAIFRGTQYGEYYGYAALVCDINGDGLDDVIITAPQYRLDGTIDIGAIYVYVNVGNMQFRQQIIEAPFTKEARFGTAITNLGDINQDGFNDIAVGAPLIGGNGAVVIYLGGRNGVDMQPSQVLTLPSNLGNGNGYFGHALSKGVDIDGNGYNDLAIGAPNNEVVYIYRTYPVLGVVLSIRTSKTSIDLQEQRISYRICYRLDRDMMVTLHMDIVADVELKRIRFDDNNSQRLRVLVLAAKFEKCQNFNATIKFVSSYIFVPIVTTVSYGLEMDGQRQNSSTFCTKCAVLDTRFPNRTASVLKYRHGCANEICNVDLSIEALDVPTEILIGSVNILSVKFIIRNKIEKAFDTQVTITNSLNLTLARTPSNCDKSLDQQIICDIARNQMFFDKFEYLDIDFDLSNANGNGNDNGNANDNENANNELIITALVTSMGNELSPHDNRIERKIQFKRYSSLEMFGSPIENLLSIRNAEILNFKYIWKIQNMGPSSVRNLEFLLHIPVAFVTKNSEEITYIDHRKISLNVEQENTEMSSSVFDVVPNEEVMANHTPKNVSYNTRQQSSSRSPQNETFLQFCNRTNGPIICAVSVLKLSSVESGKILTFNIESSFRPEALRHLLGDGRLMAFFINVTVQTQENDDSFLNVTQYISPLIVQYRYTPATPSWIYIISILSGILLFALVTLTLWKLGFFKRQSKEDMQQLLNAKHENPRPNEDTELHDGINNENFGEYDSISKT